MKQLKLFLAATIFTLALSVPTLAGDIWCPVTSQPPNESTASTTGNRQAGATSTGEITNSETITVDPVAETALQLMLTVLSLF